MIERNYPGVYVEELSSGVHTIGGVSTAVAVFVGVLAPAPSPDPGPDPAPPPPPPPTVQDLMLAPARVSSLSAYKRLLDDARLLGTGEMNAQVRQFFVNGGGTAYIVGIGQADTVGYGAAFGAIDREVSLFNLMMLPRPANAGAIEDVPIDDLGSGAKLCGERRALLLVDPPLAWQSVDDAINITTGVEKTVRTPVADWAKNSAVYWPDVRLADGTGSIGPTGSVAGVMARTDANRGVWKAPAGVTATVRGVAGVAVPLSDKENGKVNPEAINAIRPFANGVTVWGARTVAGNTGGEWTYVPVRRLALFLEESLLRGLRFAVFEPNDEPLWGQIRLAAGSFMNGLFRQGAFAGTKASDAYFVKCDAENNPQSQINLGVVTVLVGFAPLKPAEFVVIQLQQKAGQVQV